MEQWNVSALAECLQSFISRYEEWGYSVEPLRIAPPATEQQVLGTERSLGVRLPDEVRSVLTEVSAHISFRWSAGEDSQDLPEELNSVCWGGIDVGLESVASAERTRQDWLEVYSDPSDSYGTIFYDKFGVIEVDNGDVIAVDLCADSAGRVVYLSHDGDLTHGMVLGRSFAEFFDNFVRLGCPGPESWALEPFTHGKSTGLDAESEVARQWLHVVGLDSFPALL